MDDPNLIIRCLRCAKTAELSAQSARKEHGEWKAVNAQRPAGWTQGPATDVSKGLCVECTEEWKEAQKEFLMPSPPKPEPQAPTKLIMTKPAASTGVIPVRVTSFVDNTIPMDAPQGPMMFGVPMQAQRVVAPVIPPQMGQAKMIPTSFAAQSIQAKPIIPVVQQAEQFQAFKPLAKIADRVVATPEKVERIEGPQPKLDLLNSEPDVEVVISDPMPSIYIQP